MCLAICLTLFSCTLISAASLPASKAAAQITTVTTCAGAATAFATNPCTNIDGSGRWQDVMTTQIKTSNVADLFAGVSLVTGLYTSTTVKGNNTGATSTAVAEGTVRVRVLLDPAQTGCQDAAGCTAFKTLPDVNNGVVFDQRVQSLSANLGYIFTGECALSPSTCTLTPEEISLVLDTSAAHHFSFVLPNVGTGVHTLVVQAQLSTENTSIFSNTNGGISVANALFGLGSLTIDSVRLVNCFNCSADSSGAITCGY
jgi:hypothetical protein